VKELLYVLQIEVHLSASIYVVPVLKKKQETGVVACTRHRAN
jgi:hypothetical protein